jgi:hypothetical protein
VDDDSMADPIDDSANDSIDDGPAEEVEADAGIDTPEPATWTRPGSTGVASVDAAIEEVTRLDRLPTSEHVAVYEGLHRQLQDALADLDGA